MDTFFYINIKIIFLPILCTVLLPGFPAQGFSEAKCPISINPAPPGFSITGIVIFEVPADHHLG